MPAQTPIYGFTYPCPDEVVTPSAFTTLANQIDTKLNDVNSDLSFALNRNNVSLPATTTQTISANTDTVLTLSGSTYTIPVAGVWVVRVLVRTNDIPTVATMWARVRQNGVVKFGYMQNTEGDSPVPVPPHNALVAAAGDVITTLFTFIGAGTMNVTAELDAKLIVRIP
jgi:hypothetical protein